MNVEVDVFSARQTAVAASGFRMNVEVDVFSTVVGSLLIYLSDRRCTEPQTLNGRMYVYCAKLSTFTTGSECLKSSYYV
jgi:hypothetical protein